MSGLLALVLASAAGAAAQPPSQSVPFLNRTVNVCTSEGRPFVSCFGREPAQYTGHEIALFSEVSQRLGWTDAMLNWTCFESFLDFLDALKRGDGSCDIGISGIDIGVDHIQAGLHFSWITSREGKQIAVRYGKSAPNYWSWLYAFDWVVWVAILLTCLVTAIIVYLLDLWMRHAAAAAAAKHDRHLRAPPAREDMRKSETLLRTTLYVFSQPVQARDVVGDVMSLPAVLVVILFSLVMLVMVQLYTANTAANMTTRLATEINGLEDLPGKKVGTWEGFAPDITRKGIEVVSYPWGSNENEDRMFSALRSGEIDALILNTFTLQYDTYSDCSLTVVGKQFDLIDHAIVFPRGFNNTALEDAVNTALTEIKESGTSERLLEEHIRPREEECVQGEHFEGNKLYFEQVAGLWVLWACGIALAVVCAALRHVLSTSKPARMLTRRLSVNLRAASRGLGFSSRKSQASAGPATSSKQLRDVDTLHEGASKDLEAASAAALTEMGQSGGAAPGGAALDERMREELLCEMQALQASTVDAVMRRLAAARNGGSNGADSKYVA